MLNDAQYFSHLFEIASALNKEFSLQSALKKALERTVDILELETGWIWLVENEKSVYLAASYNLPPVLRDHPEKLSGWCFCIEKYFSDNISKARNISEIACSRLKNIKSGTNDLKFHATVPISVGDQKVGLINLLSSESQELNEKQLAILNTIGELIGIAIQRTQIQERRIDEPIKSVGVISEALRRTFSPKLKAISLRLQEAESKLQKDAELVREIIEDLQKNTNDLTRQLDHILDESESGHSTNQRRSHLHFPSTPLTTRELELLNLVRKGFTNKQIADTLFISERTVKFHITSVLSKLFARTRTEAVDIALKRGLISF